MKYKVVLLLLTIMNNSFLFSMEYNETGFNLTNILTSQMKNTDSSTEFNCTREDVILGNALLIVAPLGAMASSSIMSSIITKAIVKDRYLTTKEGIIMCASVVLMMGFGLTQGFGIGLLNRCLGLQ